MSGFSSLLDQFKQTTQAAAAASSSVGGGSTRGGGAAASTSGTKRPRDWTSSNTNTNTNNNTSSKQPKHHHSQKQPQQPHTFPTTPIRTIYIACPAFAETGGPEALHQLCHMINTGEYTYPISKEVDAPSSSSSSSETRGTKYDEFGRAISGNKKHAQEGDSATINNNNNSNSSNNEEEKKHDVVRAYMLYLRERGNSSVSGSVSVEHVQSSRAKSSKYEMYNAPPAMELPGELMGYDIDRGTNTTDNGGGGQQQQQQEYSSELIIWPECWTHLIDSLQPPQSSSQQNEGHGMMLLKYQISIWWLSVNNNKGRFLPHQFAVRKDILHLVQSAYAKDYVLDKKLNNSSSSSSSNTKGGDGKLKGDNNNNVDNNGNNGSGSNNVMMLTEFLPHASPTFSSKIETSATSIPSQGKKEEKEVINRDLDVVYNTAKGMHYTDEIIRRAYGKKYKTNEVDGSVGVGNGGSSGSGSIQFNPIGKGMGGRERMTGEEVVALLKRSKVVSSSVFANLLCESSVVGIYSFCFLFYFIFIVWYGTTQYIDFGPHPGMDRLPREAALAGCVVITNREGAAGFNEDVPLPSEFKFQSFTVDKIYAMLKDCCNKHGEYVTKMESYKKWILGQEKQMEVCVDRLVDRVVTRRAAAKNSQEKKK